VRTPVKSSACARREPPAAVVLLPAVDESGELADHEGVKVSHVLESSAGHAVRAGCRDVVVGGFLHDADDLVLRGEQGGPGVVTHAVVVASAARSGYLFDQANADECLDASGDRSWANAEVVGEIAHGKAGLISEEEGCQQARCHALQSGTRKGQRQSFCGFPGADSGHNRQGYEYL